MDTIVKVTTICMKLEGKWVVDTYCRIGKSLDDKNFLGIINTQYVVGSDVETDIDKKMSELLDEFAAGHECNPADCERCPNNFYCNFALPPEPAPIPAP